MSDGTTQALPPDSHEAQAQRVADYCDDHGGQFFTLTELGVACDLACASKVLSAMCRELGYGIAKAWRTTTCADNTRTRRVRIYRVTSRPKRAQLHLFPIA